MNGETPTVLIVEDDRWQAEQHKRVIEKHDIKTVVAFNCLEAVQLVDEVKPDVLLLDVLMTGNTAFALMHELQTYDDTSKIPVILCTNLAGDLDIKDLRPYGVKTIIDKSSMKQNDLVDAINGCLV